MFWVFATNVFIWKATDILNLEGFNISKFKNTIYYCYTAGVVQSQIIYTIIAITMPLIIRYLYDKIRSVLINKIVGEKDNG